MQPSDGEMDKLIDKRLLRVADEEFRIFMRASATLTVAR